MKGWFWTNVFFHILCRKDNDYKDTGGGRYRNRFCYNVGHFFMT